MKSNLACFIFLFLLSTVPVIGQEKTPAYTAVFERKDGLPIVFNLDIERTGGREEWIIYNAQERIRVTDIRTSGDSSWISMPFFESDFKLKKTGEGGYQGIWIKGTTGIPMEMPVKIRPGSTRFAPIFGKAGSDVTGRWAVTFIRPNGTSRPSVAEFIQKGDKLTGTFLTPSGDYRYLEGIMSGDSLQLSCFDGSHAYFFGARLDKNGRLVNGVFASSATWLEPWYATRDKNAKIDESLAAMQLRPGEERIGFRFPGIDSQMVSLNDERFKNKVVVIQIMGSWCPNCMDETAFLTEYYRKNRSRGVEMIALAYEYSTDFIRASKSLAKFRDRFDVQYPLLITGVTSTDSLKTEKTLPQLTPIKAFPTTIFIGKDGKVKAIHAGFYGPGTGIHHEEYKQKFYATVDELIKQYP
jgi:thiol-disulfide isomerase/thioredoxin